jgi:hypothetical protein
VATNPDEAARVRALLAELARAAAGS